VSTAATTNAGTIVNSRSTVPFTASPFRISPFTLAALGALALAAGNLGRLPLGEIAGRPAPVALGDLLLIPLWITLLMQARRSGRFALDGVGRTILLFVGVGVASLAQAMGLWQLGVSGIAGPASFLVRWLLYAGWYWLMTTTLTDSESERAVKLVQRALLLMALFGIAQSAFLPGFAQLVPWGGGEKQWDQQGRRLVSTLLDPNFAGVLVVIPLLLELARVVEQQPPRRGRLVVLAIAMLLTLSRSAILACVVGYALLLLARGVSRRLAGVTILGAVAMVPFLALYLKFAASFGKLGIDGSAAQRLIPWSRAIRMVNDHPWLGVGFNAVGPAQQAYGWKPIGGAEVSFDGGLLFVAAMTGLVGVTVYIVLLRRVVAMCRMVWRQSDNPEHRALAAGTAAASGAVVVHSLFANSLLLPFVMQVLWVLWGRVRVIQRALPVRALPVVLLAFVVSACDPCSGVIGCSTEPRLAFAGQIVEPMSGAPVRGAIVRVVGAQAVTEANGRWELWVPATAVSGQSVDVQVEAPREKPYVARVPATVVTRAGAVQELGRWNSRPFVRFQGTLLRADGTPVVGAWVSFAQAGGPPVTFAGSEPTNDGGIFSLYMAGSTEVGQAIGTLTVTHPEFARPTQLQGFALPVSQEWVQPFPVGPFVVGGRMDYGGQVYARGNSEKLAGVRLTFTRTGGIPLASDVVRATSGPEGFFVLSFPNRALGTVIGDLAIEAADGSRRSVYRGVRFDSYDSTAMRYSKSWGYGYRWAWVTELFRKDRATVAANAEVEFKQTGGPAITPSVLKGKTDAGGRIEWKADVLQSGTVVGDITVVQADAPMRVIRGVKLPSYDGDSLPFGGIYPFGSTMRYAGELFVRGTNQKAAGARVEFARTGGVALNDSVTTATADANGFFILPIVPREDGTVFGDLTVTTADGRQRSRYRHTPITSYDSTAIRTLGGIGIGDRWAYALEFWRNDVLKPAPNVRVDIRRTGGVAISPSTFSGVTNASARVEWRPTVQDTGIVELEATLYPSGEPPRIVRNLRLRTFESDELRFSGVIGFGPAFRYVIEIKTPDDRLLQGARVTWTQTGGPTMSKNSVSVVTGSDGWLRLELIPSDNGVVTGDIRIEPPAPWAPGTVFTIPGVALPTREDGDLRYGLLYRLPPP
jgi:hypothetical protein